MGLVCVLRSQEMTGIYRVLSGAGFESTFAVTLHHRTFLQSSQENPPQFLQCWNGGTGCSIKYLTGQKHTVAALAFFIIVPRMKRSNTA